MTVALETGVLRPFDETCQVNRSHHNQTRKNSGDQSPRGSDKKQRKTRATRNCSDSGHASGTQHDTCGYSLTKSSFAVRKTSVQVLHAPSTFPRSLSVWTRHVALTREFELHDLTSIFRIRLIEQQGDERHRVCYWTVVVHVFVMNNGAISLFGRLPDSKVRSEVHTHRFLARNDSITTRTEYPSLVKLSANIVQVLTSSGCAIPEEHIVP